MDSDTGTWEQTVDQVLALLTALDPYGLEPGRPDGAPDDEYRLEAEPISQHLLSHGTISTEDVDKIWNHWFDQPLSTTIDPRSMNQLITSLNRLAEAPPHEEPRPSYPGS